MPARISTLAAALVMLGAPAAAQSAPPVEYTLSPVMAGDALTRLAVEIRFRGDDDGETTLLLPASWAGSDSLWQFVEGLEVEGATAVREGDAGARVIEHRPGAVLAARYRVRSAWEAEPAFGYRKGLPLILPASFFFHGESVIATPEGRLESPARFAWRGFPAPWKVASDLDHIASGARPGTVRDVVESAAIGARELSLVQREVDGAPLRVAMHGPWDFTAEAFIDALAAVVKADNALWGDAGRPFLVPLAHVGGSGPSYSYHGTGRGDAFSVASTPGFALRAATRFLAHEYGHTWIGGEIGGHAEGNDAALGFWLTEGFTDFYAGRALLRAGLWTPEDFAAELNAVLLRYAISPVRTAPGSVVPERFWSDPHVNQLPYDRGHLLALLLDHRIRRHTGGRADLDDVMRAQRDAARRNARAGTGVDAPSLFPIVVRETLGLDVAPEIARHAVQGQAILLPADMFAPCATVETVEQPEFSRGFDLRATEAAGGVIAGVDPASPAYAAGLRDGMRLVRREAGRTGDSSVEVVYRVDDAGTERLVRYRPEGTGRITLQRLVLAPEASSPACTALMSGAADALR